MGAQDRSDVDQHDGEQERSLAADFVLFMKENKAWWIVPVLISLLLLGILVFFRSTSVSPFIYTLFRYSGEI